MNERTYKLFPSNKIMSIMEDRKSFPSVNTSMTSSVLLKIYPDRSKPGETAEVLNFES